MTAFTGHIRVGACQREVAAVMIKANIVPIGRIVAGSAIRAKLPVMVVILLMAGVTIGGCALELFVDMA